MKQWWSTLATRIDALSLRERAFLFLSVLACGLALADVLWLSPAQVAHKQLTMRVASDGVELQKLREELRLTAPVTESAKLARQELARLGVQLEAVNRDIVAASSLSGTSTPLKEVLVHFLRRHDRLSLVRVGTMPEAAGATPAARPGGAAVADDVAALGLVRQGVELTVSGPYAELANYTQTLESALPTLRWGPMKLVSEKQPPELTIQVFLVGVRP